MTRANNSMSTASLILGILACISTAFMTVYPPFIFGGLSIICGILSRDRSGMPDHNARAGMFISAMGMTVNIVIVAFSVYSVFHNPEQYAVFDELFKRFYGMDFETFTNSSLRNII